MAMTASLVAATENHEHHHEHGNSGGKEFAGVIDGSTGLPSIEFGSVPLSWHRAWQSRRFTRLAG